MPKKFSLKSLAPLLALVLFGLIATVALAHPLGNFTINHYARLEFGTNQLRVRYVLDYAEIPTFQEKQSMGADNNGQVADAQRSAYLDTHLKQLIGNLKLTVNHQPVALLVEPGSAQLEFLPGQGGLEVMRLSAWLDAPFTLVSNGTTVEFSDNNYSDRLGWREIVVPGTSGVTIQNSNVPAQDTSRELTLYPADLLSNPRNDRAAEFTVVPGAGNTTAPVAASGITTGALGAFDRTRDAFGELITSNQELSPIVLLVSFLAAMALGAVHAFSPGHGKAVVGAYLVGSRGNWQHAVFLGLVVTITHTAGVYALGAVTLFLSAYVLPEQLFPWLGFVSGLLVAIIGVRLFLARLRAARTQTTSYDKAMTGVNARAHAFSNSHSHDHAPVHEHADGAVHFHAPTNGHTLDHAHVHENAAAHDNVGAHEHNHNHNHNHNHDHEHVAAQAHTHSDGSSHTHDFATPEQEAAHAREHLAEIQAFEKSSWRNLLSLGISGGLLPCPSALVVMLSAIALGRVLYGFFLIIGFSLGLAGVLVLTGLALLYAGKYASRLFGGQRVGVFMRYVPIVGAVLVALLGLGIALDAVFQTGLVR